MKVSEALHTQDHNDNNMEGNNMPVAQYVRSKGQKLTYTIVYDQAEYFIERDGQMKKSMPDTIPMGMAPHEATPELMLKTAQADIESLLGMDE